MLRLRPCSATRLWLSAGEIFGQATGHLVCGVHGNIVLKTDYESPDLMETIFQTQLFPDLSDAVRVPNLHTKTREQFYSIILALANDQKKYQDLLVLIKALTIQGDEGSQAWSWGTAQTVEDYTYEPNWNFEPSKAIRASVGYPGLRNLSNTCYMNSLFAQLFMNTKFRAFMLNVNVADSGTSQRLLHETQTLFGFMQESTLKSVDTQNIAESIVTYDNTAVDVTHQVDVDEFYNLLFDRWESQILAEEDKKTFRGFFGGQIVQQIKSKECPHISERMEPFSAIQCDISGKNTLAESLNAYVQGEAMEGGMRISQIAHDQLWLILNRQQILLYIVWKICRRCQEVFHSLTLLFLTDVFVGLASKMFRTILYSI